MSRRIYFDGLNLSLERGTGIATYTRMLASVVRELGNQVGVVYSSPSRPAKNPLLREVSFFDTREAVRTTHRQEVYNAIVDQVHSAFGIKPQPVELTGAVIAQQFKSRLPTHDYVYLARNLFSNARRYFAWSGNFATLEFDTKPDVLHCTYQLPVRAKSACNVYTVHDLVPLRLPFTTLDNKRQTYRLLRKIAAEADHIVTVSENSKRDIVQLLGVDEERVTNTYQAVDFPRQYVERPLELVAEHLYSTFRLEMGSYLLFYGAFEPKKNIARLIEGYLMSAVDLPLVILGPAGWGTTSESKLLDQLRADADGGRPRSTGPGNAGRTGPGRRVYRFEYATLPMLVTLIRGARAVLFPSLYEGFGLPVLEAMQLGTPVVTSRASSIPEIAGEAALYVNPYEVEDIAQAIKAICGDDGLCEDLVRRGRVQAELFSVERYRDRVAALYAKLV